MTWLAASRSPAIASAISLLPGPATFVPVGTVALAATFAALAATDAERRMSRAFVSVGSKKSPAAAGAPPAG